MGEGSRPAEAMERSRSTPGPILKRDSRAAIFRLGLHLSGVCGFHCFGEAGWKDPHLDRRGSAEGRKREGKNPCMAFFFS